MYSHKPVSLELPVVSIAMSRWNLHFCLRRILHSSLGRLKPGHIFILLAPKTTHQSFHSHRHTIHGRLIGDGRRLLDSRTFSKLVALDADKGSTGSDPVSRTFSQQYANWRLPSTAPVGTTFPPYHGESPWVEHLRCD